MDGIRRERFNLGTVHGKPVPKVENSEAAIQRGLYLKGLIKIVRSKNQDKNSLVRIFGYEIPLEKRDKKRVRCADLLGYDQSYNLYLFELKDKDSKEDFSNVVNQINNYEEILLKIKPYIEQEFYESLFFKIKFHDQIRKVILAPREFYKNVEKKQRTVELHKDIEYAFFRALDTKNLTDASKVVNIHIWKWKK